jgi:predicted nucleic acid-binding protein
MILADTSVWIELFRRGDRVPDEGQVFVEMNRLHNLGLGWIDMHLLAAARLGHCGFYTRDRRLAEAAKNLRLGM